MATPPTQKTVVGERFAGRFRIERLLGRGGMAEVYEATDVARGGLVAVKILRADVARHPDALERFRREGVLLRSLDHPAIVSAETFGETDDGRTFIVMEKLTGRTLHTMIQSDAPMAPEQVALLVNQISAALVRAHGAGAIHRDLKPGNIMVVDTDEGPRVKVLDFGVSRMLGQERITQTGELLGTPRYMAPEQLEGRTDIDARVDVYALGVIAFEALCGRSPFPGETPSELAVAILQGRAHSLAALRPDLGAGIAAVVDRALSHDREARHADAESFARAWRKALEAEPTAIDLGRHSPTLPGGSLEPDGERPPVAGERALVLGTFGKVPAHAASPGGVGPAPRTTQSRDSLAALRATWLPNRTGVRPALLLALLVIVTVAAAVTAIAVIELLRD
jgi:serine/threonine protein kinase